MCVGVYELVLVFIHKTHGYMDIIFKSHGDQINTVM